MTKPKTKIRLADEFSRFPAGRYLTDGLDSGEAFREKFLVPRLVRGELIEIDLDGAEGFGSSFLEEAFAGTMRKMKLSAADFNSRVAFVAIEDPSLLHEIAGYVAEQESRRTGKKG